MTEIRDIELNTGTHHKCEISGGEQAGTGIPMVFAAGLNDEELADFLDSLVMKLRARLKASSEPGHYREATERAEAKLIELNKIIEPVVCRQINSLIKTACGALQKQGEEAQVQREFLMKHLQLRMESSIEQ